jgi:hypothetical protein
LTSNLWTPELLVLALLVLFILAVLVVELAEGAWRRWRPERFPRQPRFRVRLTGPERKLTALPFLDREKE